VPRLPSSLTIAEANAALRALEADLGPGSGPVVVDASPLAAFDTSAIAVLLEVRRQAQAVGRPMTVQGAPSTMIELAQMYGVRDLLGFDGAAA
jgi:phospholipid transport system transporter-binding protein